MSAWHLGDMVAFDTETTGVDVFTDRIVTACAANIEGSGRSEPGVHTWLLDPGIEIPEAATAIHGVSTEHARDVGTDPAVGVLHIAAVLTAGWEAGAFVVGHNVAYDLSILDAELRRHHGHGLDVAGAVVDTMVLDKAVDRYRRGKRTLTATCEHYGVRLDGAHDASYDALAAARIAWRIAAQNADIAGMSLQELHDFQVGQARAQAASLQEYFRREDPHAVVDGSWPLREVAA